MFEEATHWVHHEHMTKAALSHLRDSSAVVNTTSVTAYRGTPHLPD
jgi:NAD(P)-dependent dehydrogenase (short-subunit alcohol dehydrogenase family)